MSEGPFLHDVSQLLIANLDYWTALKLKTMALQWLFQMKCFAGNWNQSDWDQPVISFKDKYLLNTVAALESSLTVFVVYLWD